MTPKISIVTVVAGATLALAASAFGQPSSLAITEMQGRGFNVLGSGSAVSDATQYRPSYYDALRLQESLGTATMLDARERSFAAKLDAALGSATGPDVVQRAVDAHARIPDPVVDDRFRIEPTPVEPIVVSDGREIEWPQVGIGLGIGLLLALGLALTLRFVHVRQPAH